MKKTTVLIEIQHISNKEFTDIMAEFMNTSANQSIQADRESVNALKTAISKQVNTLPKKKTGNFFAPRSARTHRTQPQVRGSGEEGGR